MMPICFYIGVMTICSVSFEKVSEAAVKMMQVKMVVANCNYASEIYWSLILNLTYATKSWQSYFFNRHSLGV